jgi:hypothetical protein
MTTTRKEIGVRAWRLRVPDTQVPEMPDIDPEPDPPQPEPSPTDPEEPFPKEAHVERDVRGRQR